MTGRRPTRLPANPSRTASAQPPAVGAARFWFPSVTDLIFLGLLLSLSFGALAPHLLADAGIGWHIRNGQLIIQTHSITRTDPFSSTMNGQPWYAWEWLFDMIVAAAYGCMGLNGVVFFAALVVAGTFALALRFTLNRGGSLPVAVVFLALCIGASAIHLLARPHVLSWLLAVIWFQILDSWETASGPANNRRLLWLPILMLFWVNLHGGFLAGFALLALYLASEFVGYITVQGPGRRSVIGERGKWLAGISALSFLATFLNPYGYRLHVHIYQYLSDRFLMDHIQEFRSPDFHGAAQQCFAALLLITIVALAAARRRPRISQLFVVVFAAGSGLYAARNLPVSSLLLMLIVAPILAETMTTCKTDPEIAPWLRNFFLRYDSFASRMAGIERSVRGHLWPAAAVVLGVGICVQGGKLGAWQLMDAHFPAKRFPVLATDEIVHRDIREPLFCPDYWGGYLIYRLYPQTKVVVDDRHDLYGEQFLKQYLKAMRVEPGWNRLLDEAHVDWALLPSDSALAAILQESPAWTMVYRDKVAELFQRH
jgi:hypothetical protein